MKTIYSCTAAILTILLGAALFTPHVMKAGLGSPTAPKPAASPAANAAQKMHLAENYGKLPLSFEANQGQTDSRVKFLSRGRGYSLFLTGDEAVLAFQTKVAQHPPSGAAAFPNPLPLSGTKKSSNNKREKPRDRTAGPALRFSSGQSGDGVPTSTALRMRLIGANASAKATGAEELSGKSNYFIGNDPKKWRTNVPTYAQVKYQGVYPGVDLVYYGNQGGQLEYDFVVAPGADPNIITLDVGADGVRPMNVGIHGAQPTKGERHSPLRIAANGDLIVSTDGGEVRFHKPVVYQNNSVLNHQSSIDNRQFLDGHYVLQASNQVGFKVASYDHTQPLIIDPVLSYSTFLGGSGGDFGNGIALDSAGNAYVTGYTGSINFPTASPIQGTYGGGTQDAFVTKLNAAGSALIYSTYLGGSGIDLGNAIAVDSAGNAYVTGQTNSTNFPTVNPFQVALAGGFDAFVTKLNAAGNALVYSTYLGGAKYDTGYGIAVDSTGDAYVTGQTSSPNFPTVGTPFQGTLTSGSDAFVTKLNPAGNVLVYSTYLGGYGINVGNIG